MLKLVPAALAFSLAMPFVISWSPRCAVTSTSGAALDVKIKAASIDTGTAKRDEHLR